MVYNQRRVSTMALYLNLKFKMKLSYQAWQTKKSVKDLVIQAVETTVDERFAVARSDLQRFLYN